ncbi:DUF3558 domain-containing protein [Nocardia takedensis]|uniref:DUF3558 domain-containing protein n=1 Tax=Nocardia takedensis TaxID=259390 RepID=UPI00030FBA01|nr:DUF3558 domain-containing protein [Nocardia takedensis]
MRIAKTVGVAVVASVVAVGAVGCESTTEGAAGPEGSVDPSAAAATLWDPCTQIDDATLQSVGVLPSTKRSGVAGIEEPGWKVCSWRDASTRWQYTLGVWSTVNTVDSFRQKPENVGFTPVEVSGRPGFQFLRSTDKRNEDCHLVFPAVQGALSLTVFNSADGTTPPCDRLTAAAANLVPTLPS